MTPLAILICLGMAAARGALPTADDARVLAEIGLKSVGGELLQADTAPAPHRAGGVAGIRQSGPVCHWLLAGWAGQPLRSAPLTEAAPAGHGGLGTTAFGGFGSPLDSRDFAALVSVPGVSVIPIGGPLAVLPGNPETVVQPVSVPEPSSIAILAVGLAGLAMVRRWGS